MEDPMIVVGMSGGVDSSVAALLLKRRGETLRGCFMANWPSDDPACRAERDRADALRVCGMLDIPFAARNFSEVYRKEVFDHFLADYATGRTPNPDVLCNREVKFKVFLDDAVSQGATRMATGHYARKEMVRGRAVLLRAIDPGKDQSYFLHAISQRALDMAEFPIGHLPKSCVRAIAQEAGLLTSAKPDSTGICFIEPGNFREFLGSYLPAQPGPMVDQAGVVLGQHAGALYFTVGQRAPLGGVKGRSGEGWFVQSKRVQDNTLVLVQGSNHPALFASGLVTDPVSWIGDPPSAPFYGEVQIRHLGEANPSRVTLDVDGCAHVAFNSPVRAVAPGQAAAFYQGDRCLGGAPIAYALT
jgi:tRNA-specific 2-thiouridylase